jgi:predicted ATPase/DNA-binding winged helix-turn-helix (wHTH) protein
MIGLAREAGADAPPLRFGRFELRPRERRLMIDGVPALIGPRAYDMLLALVERRGRLVSKDELFDAVWPGLVVEENNLQKQVSALRKVLGADVIVTIPGRGYQFVAGPDPGAVADDAARKAPPPAVKLRTNLPPVLTALIGRDDDLAALGALIERHRLVSIVGAGGIGKTRVAQALLAQRPDRYEHGVCFVELAPIGRGEGVAAAIGAALGVNIGGSGEAIKGLVNAVAPLSVLIALDNAEHVLSAVAATAEALLAGAARVRIAVTSQAPLKISGERIYRLGALAVPEDIPSVDEALTYGAVALFAERARAADRRFELRDANVVGVIELCQRLDGLALAIELAAARAPLLGLPKLLASLDQRLRVLAGGARTAPARQQTLRAALEWSHGLLDEPAQIVLRRLGVFAGAASLEAVQQVVADESGDGIDEWAVLDELGTLVDRSLVNVVDEVGATAAPRYRLLETPLAFAQERLRAAGEEAALRQRHTQAMRRIFQQAYGDLWEGRAGVDAWQESLRPVVNDGRAAVMWAIAEDTATALAIVAPLTRALGQNQYRECRTLWETVEPLLDGLPTQLTQSPALIAHAALECARHWTDSRPQHSLQRAKLALDHFRRAGDLAGCYRALARIANRPPLGDPAEVEAALQEMERIEDPTWPPIVLSWGATARYRACLNRGDVDAARHFLRRQIDLERAAGLANSVVLNNLADAALAAGSVDEAVASGRALLELFAGSRHQRSLAYARLNLTAALLVQDRPAEARAVALDGWPNAPGFDQQVGWADHLAFLAACEGRSVAALRLVGYADAVYAARNKLREVNERRAVERAEQLARAALAASHDAPACDRFKAEGAGLRDEDIFEVAFAGPDAGVSPSSRS